MPVSGKRSDGIFDDGQGTLCFLELESDKVDQCDACIVHLVDTP